MKQFIFILLVYLFGVFQDVLGVSLICGPPPRIKYGYPIVGNVTNRERNHGAVATYICREGRTLVERGKVVCDNGKWNGTLPECVHHFCRIPYVEHGEMGKIRTSHGLKNYGEFHVVSMGERIESNEILFLRCKEGFSPKDADFENNRLEVKCKDGAWSKDLQCIDTKCYTVDLDVYTGLELPEKEFVLHSGSFKVECNEGYDVLNPGANITCFNGIWVTEQEPCTETICHKKDLDAYEGLKVPEEEVLLHLKSFEVECIDGYDVLIPRPNMTCLNGTWFVDQHPCKKKFCSVPDIENGEVGQMQIRQISKWRSYKEFKKVSIGESMKSNDTVLLRCKDGFLPIETTKVFKINQAEMTCNNGRWSKVLECKLTSCFDNPPSTKGGRAVVSNRAHGYMVWYSCNRKNDYKVTGNVTCYFGTWIGTVPKCLNSPCFRTHLNYFGLEIPPEDHFESTESFDILCKQGFRKSTSATKITCNRGSWDINENPCVKEGTCEEPMPPEYGTVRLSGDLKVGSLAIYTCATGRVLYGASTSRCLISGEWTFEPPKCLRFCSVPDIEYGEVGIIQIIRELLRTYEEFTKLSAGEHVKPNETVLLRCKEGFLPFNDSTVFENNLAELTCNDGTWSKDMKCREAYCSDDPPETKNGKAMVIGRKHGYTIWYKCKNNSNFKIKGNVTCHFGSWIGIVPKCLISPCFTKQLNYLGLETPTEGFLSSRESFDIVCKEGFRKSTSSTKITCNSGKWDTKENPCIKESQCAMGDLAMSVPTGVVPDMTFVTEEYTLPGTETRLVCEDGLIPDGNSIATCRNDGEWKLGKFQCVERCLLKVDPSSHLLIVPSKENYRFGESVLLSCPPGKVRTTDVERLMCLGKIWSDSIPDCKESE